MTIPNIVVTDFKLVCHTSLISQYQKYHAYYSSFVPPKLCISIVFIFSWDLQWSKRETGNNAYAKFWRDKQNLIIPKASVLKSYSDFNRDSGKLGNNPSAFCRSRTYDRLPITSPGAVRKERHISIKQTFHSLRSSTRQ